jgi:hypothetical protein
MSLRKLILVAALAWAIAPSCAHADQALFNAHTENVRASVENLLQSGLLPPEWEAASRDGLVAFLEEREQGDSSRASEPLVPHEFRHEALGRDLDRKLKIAKQQEGKRFRTKKSEILSIGSLLCLAGDQMLLNGRFLVSVNFQNLSNQVGIAFGCQMTRAAGYFFFFDKGNVEIPLKMLNACFGGSPASHWVFAAGLTNFGVEISIFDLATGIRKSYLNPTGRTFVSIIDQQTPFPCP